MSGPRVILRCMNGSGGSSSPGGTIDCTLPYRQDVTVTHLIYKDGDVMFEHAHERRGGGGDGHARLALAEIRSSGLSVLLKALTSLCFVELPPASRSIGTTNLDRIEVPKSVADTNHWIHLRPDDILNFERQGVKVRLDVESHYSPHSVSEFQAEAMTSATEPVAGDFQDDVQVKSSNVHGDDDAVTDSDADLDTVPAFGDAPAVGMTPKKPRPDLEPAIKETPNAERTRASSFTNTDGGAEDAALFSTARDDEVDHNSLKPSFQAIATLAQEERAIQEAQIDNENRTSDKSSADLPYEQEPVTNKTVTTYSQRNSNSTPYESLPDAKASTMDGIDVEPNISVGESQSDAEYNARLTVTSEPLAELEVAEETARRSMKRKSDSGKENLGQRTSSKKRRVNSGNNDSDSDALSESTPPTRKSSVRRKKPTGHTPEQDVEADTDEIAVAPSNKRNISPQVIVRQRDSETPASAGGSPMIGKTPKVLLSSNSTLRKSAAKWLKEQGSEILDDVKSKRTNFICVVKDDSLKTAKVLRSLALGKQVVTENWIIDSKKAGEFLDTDDYIHPDIQKTATVQRRNLFHGHNLFFTNTLADKVYMSGWQDIQSLAKEAGASSVHKGSSADFGQLLGRQSMICFGADNSDPDVGRLQTQHGCTVYHRSLIPHAVISGKLNLGDEKFHLPTGNSRKRR